MFKNMRILFTCATFCGSFSSGYSNEEYSPSSEEFSVPQTKLCSCGCLCGEECSCGCHLSGSCECRPDDAQVDDNDAQVDDNDAQVDDNDEEEESDDEDEGAPPVTYQPSFDQATADAYGKNGVWLPEDPVLYRPMIADPRQICYSVGWRFDDQVLVKNVIDVSFGDSFPIYRWFHVGPWDGELQIDLEGAAWAIFDPLHESSPLINADYYGGIPITYAFGNWEFRLRFFHISSHIGDEFLIDHPDFDRRNASAEYVDFFASNDITDEIRLYGGIGYIVALDREFKCSRFYAEAGTEVRFSGLGFYARSSNLYGEPFLAMHFRWKKDFKHHLDQTYALGYEIGKTNGLCRKFRGYVEYHDGYSLEGQFCKLATNYLSFRVQYGF